jgi:hypothetical protein
MRLLRLDTDSECADRGNEKNAALVPEHAICIRHTASMENVSLHQRAGISRTGRWDKPESWTYDNARYRSLKQYVGWNHFLGPSLSIADRGIHNGKERSYCR